MNALAIAAIALHAILVVALTSLLVVATTMLLRSRKPMEVRVQKLDVLMEKADTALDNVNTINFKDANHALNKINALGGILG